MITQTSDSYQCFLISLKVLKTKRKQKKFLLSRTVSHVFLLWYSNQAENKMRQNQSFEKKDHFSSLLFVSSLFSLYLAAQVDT